MSETLIRDGVVYFQREYVDELKDQLKAKEEECEGLRDYLDGQTLLNKELKEENQELREFKVKAMPILDNVSYWETCPDDYKCALKELLQKGGEGE